jgi:general secretion pathway protein J
MRGGRNLGISVFRHPGGGRGRCDVSRNAEAAPASAGMTNALTSFPNSGFTLIELVVALFVFGLLASAGVTLLSGSVRAQAAASARLAEVATERRLTALLTADLLQALPRVTRSITGEPEQAFRGGNDALVLSYVRGGWANSEDAPRASIQRVEIIRDKTQLIRTTRAMADGTRPGNPTVLAGNVVTVQVRFRDKGEWVDVWDPTRKAAMPRVVELVITRTGGAPLRRLFVVGSGY